MGRLIVLMLLICTVGQTSAAYSVLTHEQIVDLLWADQIAPLLEAYGKHLRATFIAKHGYPPEDSATPYVPVTIDGPQDHDAYYAKEYP